MKFTPTLINLHETPVRLLKLLCRMAMLCRGTSMKDLVIVNTVEYVPAKIIPDFFTLINASLHCNPAMERLTLPLTPTLTTTLVSTMSHALCQDPDTAQQNLKRSTSLCDLTTVGQSLVTPVRRRQSCPDLFELQSLHTMHPLLRRAMKTLTIFQNKT